MRRTLFSLFFVLGALGLLRAQNYHYVGNYQTPPSSNRYDGFNTQNAPTLWVYNNSASQLVYPASDLQPLVGKLITSVKFKFYNESWYHSEVYSSTMKIHITEVGQEKLKYDSAGLNAYVWYDVDLNSSQIAITDTFTPYNVVGNDRELVFDFSSNPYQYNGGNLLITVTASSDVNADGAVVAYYYYKPSHRKKCAAVWGSDSRQFSDVYTAGGRILNNGVGLGYSTAIDNDLPVVAFGYSENINTNCPTPSSLRAIDSTHNSVKIAWTAGGSETEWTVQYRKASESAWTTFSPNVTATPEATIAGLEAGTQYAFRVKAVCSPTEESTFGTPFLHKTLCTSVSTVSENFEGTPVESIPNCWTRIIGGSITKFPSVVASKTTFGVPSKAMAFAHRQPQFVILPAMSVPLNTLQLKFKLNREHLKCGVFKVGYMSDPNDTSTFVAVASFDDSRYKAMSPKQVFFTGVSDNGGVNRYIAFRSGYKPTTVESYDYYYWVDDVEVSPAPTCMPATNLKVSNIKHDAADISFKHEASANTWQYVYTDDPSANPDALTPTTITTDSITVSGLTPDTEYRFWVRTKCSPTDSSEWSLEPITFRTVCQEITSLPWTVDFASPMATNGNLPSCWTKVLSYKGGWPTKIYPEVVKDSLVFKTNNYYLNKSHNLVVTPKFGVALDTLEVSFTLTRTDKKSAPFVVGVMSDPSDTATFVAMDNIASTDNLPHTYDVSLAAAPATHRYIAFFLKSHTTGSSGYEMDDVDVHVLPACRRPIRLSVEEATISTDSAVVSWNAGGTETRWTLEYKTRAAGEWITIDSISTTRYTLKHLKASTQYLVRVKSLCTAISSESAFTSESIFYTLCGATALPWMEDFSQATATMFPPRCWARYDQKASDVFGGAELKNVTTSSFLSGIWQYDNSTYGMNTGGKAKINIFGSSTYGWLVTPSIRLEANSVLEFDLSFTKHNSSDKATGTRADDKFMVIVSTDNGTTWAEANATVWSNDSTATHRLNNVSNIATPFTVDLSKYSGVVKIAFYAESLEGSNGNNDLYLDNILVKRNIPPTVVTLPADNITHNTATLHKKVTEGSYLIDEEGFFYKADTTSALWRQATDSVLTGLSPHTTYLYYAFAQVKDSVYRGATLSFTTTGNPVVHPTVTTEAATDITQMGATLHKTVTADPSEPVTEQGWKWRKATDATWFVSLTGRLTSLEQNTKYEFYAYAKTDLNADGYNGSTLTFTTLAHTPPTVTTLDATAIGMYAATLRKTVAAGTEPIVEQGWKYKKVGEVIWTQTTDGNLSGLGQNTEYEFYAYAVTNTYPMTKGETLRFTTFSASDVDRADYRVVVYPNPADDFVTIALDGSTDGADVQISDMLGRVVSRYRIAAGESGISLDVSSFAAGNYLVRIVSGDRVVIEKLIIEQK
ncbi:MAG: fibronectin type III domain-containing protein [Bacteroidota bacterium]